MSAIPPIAPVGPSSSPTEIDAFRQAMNAAGQALGADPSALGRSLMDGIENFRSEEAAFRSQASAAIDNDGVRTDPGGPSPQRLEGEAPPDAGPGSGSNPREAMQRTQARSVGLMMQTYSFALEATLVGNAATTFTNSINTLIKTQ